MLDLSEKERQYLVTLLKAAHTELLHELHHADASEYKEQLRKQIEINELLTAKAQGKVPVTV